MELGVRDWMIIVGVLLILAVLLDGYRRVRNERRGKIRMSLNKQFLNTNEVDEEITSSELPNGGARIVGRHRSRSQINSERGAASHLDLEQSVPLLMESVASANLAGELADPDEPVSADLFTQPSTSRSPAQVNSPSRKAKPEPAPEPVSEPESEHTDEVDTVELRHETAPQPEPQAAPAYSGQQEIIVINVVTPDEPFQGPDLLHILLACDLRYGKMNIFHRHEQANGRGQVQFSVANSVEPGTFNLDAISGFTTPGVCFFMSVPGPEEPLKAFECMVETAQCLIRNLGGELLDDSRSALTQQTVEHYRQRLQEFERRQLAQA